MSKQTVANKILQDAKGEAKAITRRYTAKIEKVKNEFAEELKARRKAIETHAEEMKRIEINRTIAQERLRLDKQLTERKRRLIDDVVEQAISTINGQKEYEGFLKALIITSTLRAGELHINDQDWQIYGSTIESFLKQKNYDFTVVKDKKLRGGVTIQHEKTTHHGSLDLIRELIQEELAIAVSKQVL